ncbi:MAG: PIN domain-containing protein [Saprospiraceae bacterium]
MRVGGRKINIAFWINDHKDKIIKLTGYDEREYGEVEFLVYKQVDFFSESTIPFEFWQKAADFVRGIDMDDITFVVKNRV